LLQALGKVEVEVEVEVRKYFLATALIESTELFCHSGRSAGSSFNTHTFCHRGHRDHRVILHTENAFVWSLLSVSSENSVADLYLFKRHNTF
jgi:hypothetical protein